MQFYRDTSNLPVSGRSTVLTIGNFDGVHLGHQMILAEVVRRARNSDAIATLMTFDPPPARVLGRTPFPQLMTLEEKRAVVEHLGIDLFVCETFNLALAAMAPVEFMRDLLEARLHPVEIMVGYDFCFGERRSGNFHTLREYFEPRGCNVEQFRALTRRLDIEGEPLNIVSSSLIRRLVTEGKVGQARKLLGRPHTIRGQVVHGDARGRQLGFPTANLHNGENLLPADGVYVARAVEQGNAFAAVANLGCRPTFSGDVARIEAHLLDFQGDLYGRTIRLELLERLRAEKRFKDMNALRAQIERDVAEARRFFAHHPGVPASA